MTIESIWKRFRATYDRPSTLRESFLRAWRGDRAQRKEAAWALLDVSFEVGVAGVAAYARALLAGRPELWPAVVGRPTLTSGVAVDHGTELARMVEQQISIDRQTLICSELNMGS